MGKGYCTKIDKDAKLSKWMFLGFDHRGPFLQKSYSKLKLQNMDLELEFCQIKINSFQTESMCLLARELHFQKKGANCANITNRVM